MLNWYTALNKQGTVTHGFDIWPITQKFSPSKDEFKGEFKLFDSLAKPRSTLLICLNDKYNYEAFCNGKKVELKKIHDGLYAFEITQSNGNIDNAKVSILKKQV